MLVSKAKKISLYMFIGFLILTAIIGILSVLSGEFGELQLKILVTTFSISSASICSMSCAAFIEQKSNKLGFLGIGCAVLATIMVNGIIWIDGASMPTSFWKSTISLIIFSIAFAHAFLLLLPKLNPEHQWTQKLASITILLLSTMIFVAVWAEVDSDLYYRVTVIISICVVLISLIIPILMRMRREDILIDEKKEETMDTLVLTKQPDGTYKSSDNTIYRVIQISDEK